MHFNFHLRHLTTVPGKQIAQLALVGFGTGRDKCSAELAGFFMNYRIMSAQFEHTGGLHSTDTSADDMHRLRRGCLADVMLVPLHGFGIDGTAGKVQTVRKILIVRNAFVVTHIEAAVVAENTWTDILFPTLLQFDDPLPVGKEGTGKTGTVKLPCCDGLRRRAGIKPSGANYRNVYKLFNMFNIGEVAVFRHIDRRMRPVPGIIGAVVAVQAVIARILQIFCGPFRLRHIAACLNIVLPWQSSFTETLGL